MSFHKFTEFVVPVVPTSRKPVPSIPIAQLVKNKWQLPFSSTISASNASSSSSSIVPSSCSSIVRSSSSSTVPSSSALMSSGVVKNVNINGKIVPLKLIKINSPNQMSATLNAKEPALNPKAPPTSKSSTKTFTFLPQNQRQKHQRKSNDNQNFSSDSDGDESSSGSSQGILLPINEVEDVYKMERKMDGRYMNSLLKFLKRRLVGNDNVMLQLLEIMYTPKCVSKFNCTGKKKERFKSLRVNKVFMAILKLNELEYWQKVASAIHVMDRRYARELANQQ